MTYNYFKFNHYRRCAFASKVEDDPPTILTLTFPKFDLIFYFNTYEKCKNFGSEVLDGLSLSPPLPFHLSSPLQDLSELSQTSILSTSDISLEIGVSILQGVLEARDGARMKEMFDGWVQTTLSSSLLHFLQEKSRWSLHASVNEDSSPMAWYHSHFQDLIFRLSSDTSFWSLPCQLIHYPPHQAHSPVSSSFEDDLLSRVLVSPSTTSQDILPLVYAIHTLILLKPSSLTSSSIQVSRKRLFSLFHNLLMRGVDVERDGEEKSWRLSFVKQTLYLTWNGKGGNQGIVIRRDMDNQTPGEINSINITSPGLQGILPLSERGKGMSFGLENEKDLDLVFQDQKKRDEFHHLFNILAFAKIEDVEDMPQLEEEIKENK